MLCDGKQQLFVPFSVFCLLNFCCLIGSCFGPLHLKSHQSNQINQKRTLDWADRLSPTASSARSAPSFGLPPQHTAPWVGLSGDSNLGQWKGRWACSPLFQHCDPRCTLPHWKISSSVQALKFRCKMTEDNLISINVKSGLPASRSSQQPFDVEPADHAELLSHGRIKQVKSVIRKRG